MMTEEKDWLVEWKDMMCGMMDITDEWFPDTKTRCEPPDGIVTCNECRYGDYKSPPPPETCSECEECVFSWHDSEWHCADKVDDESNRMILDNDIYTTVHENCPWKRGND